MLLINNNPHIDAKRGYLTSLLVGVAGASYQTNLCQTEIIDKVTLPVLKSKLRLYCLRLTDKILVLGNGDVKNIRTYKENETSQVYVMDLQRFEKLL